MRSAFDASGPLVPRPLRDLPHLGGDPSARAGHDAGQLRATRRVGGPRSFSSPDTPGMPRRRKDRLGLHAGATGGRSDGRWTPPAGFEPVTQLEHARLGTVTPEMRRVAEREPHLTPEQVRDEVAAGRMVIPANRVHLRLSARSDVHRPRVDTKINANMGASPVIAAAPTRKSRSCAGPSAGAPTR